MAAIQGSSTLDFFRANKEQPIVQFVTWYILLVKEWSFDDIQEVLIRLMEPRDTFGVKQNQQSWSFTFRNGRTIQLLFVEIERNNWYCELSTEVYISPRTQPQQVTQATKGENNV